MGTISLQIQLPSLNQSEPLTPIRTMKPTTKYKMRNAWKQVALSLAASAALMTGTAQAGTWAHNAWTNDATSGITGVQADYTVAVNTGTAGDAAVTVNGIAFGVHATSGTNFSMAGAMRSIGSSLLVEMLDMIMNFSGLTTRHPCSSTILSVPSPIGWPNHRPRHDGLHPVTSG